MMFFRDQRVSSVSIDEGVLERLFKTFEATHKAAVDFEAKQDVAKKPDWYFWVIMRADGKGFRFWDFPSFIEAFRNAQKVERIVFTVENTYAMNSNRNAGQFAEVRLDALDTNNCSFAVMANQRNDGEIVFGAVKEILDATRNSHWLVRSAPARIFIQLLGVATVFWVSLWGASLLRTKLNVESAFLFAFLFIFIIAMNLWTPLYPWVLGHIDRVFPNVYFRRTGSDRWKWLWQNLVAAALFAAFLVVGSLIVKYIGNALAPLWVQ